MSRTYYPDIRISGGLAFGGALSGLVNQERNAHVDGAFRLKRRESWENRSVIRAMTLGLALAGGVAAVILLSLSDEMSSRKIQCF